MISGGHVDTTNNRMEMQGAIEALKEVGPVKAKSILTTDSDYLKMGMTQYIKNWKRNGWKTAKKTPVKNKEQWQDLDAICSIMPMEWRWTKAHAGHPENERVDKEAGRQMRIFRDGPKKPKEGPQKRAREEEIKEEPPKSPTDLAWDAFKVVPLEKIAKEQPNFTRKTEASLAWEGFEFKKRKY